MFDIETTDLTYTYPGRKEPSISNITIRIKKGEFVLITGPSGCGKTTLCRCFNGLIPHFYQGTLKGEMMIDGLQVRDHPIHQLSRRVGLVFQNPENQLFALSVEKDVAFGLENLGIPRREMQRRVDSALSQTGIHDLRERAPHELSGGQQQRVAIASVLAMKPGVVVLDEPTSFLDPVGATEIFEVIHRLNRELGITVVLVEHRLDLASKYAHHIVVMNRGRVALDGKPREILGSEEPRLIGVGIPKTTALYNLLKRDKVGIDSRVPLSADEMANMLRRTIGSQ